MSQKYKASLSITTKDSTLKCASLVIDNTVPTAAAAKSILGIADLDSGILPPVVRWVNNTYTEFLVEYTPTTVDVEYSNSHKGGVGLSNSITRKFTLPLPWQLYYIKLIRNKDGSLSLVGFKAFFRPTSITSLKDDLYHIPLSNIYRNGNACIDGLHQNLSETKKINQFLREAIAGFWNSGFNQDIPIGIYSVPESLLDEEFPSWGVLAGDQAFKMLEGWSDLSVLDTLKLDWSVYTPSTDYPDSSTRSWLNTQVDDSSNRVYTLYNLLHKS